MHAPAAGLVTLTAIFAVQWRKAHQVASEVRLKERMIERGFTAGEIETVIKATAAPERVGKAAQLRGPRPGESDVHGLASEPVGV